MKRKKKKQKRKRKRKSKKKKTKKQKRKKKQKKKKKTEVESRESLRKGRDYVSCFLFFSISGPKSSANRLKYVSR